MRFEKILRVYGKPDRLPKSCVSRFLTGTCSLLSLFWCFSAASAQEIISRQLVPNQSAAVLEIRQPHQVFQHSLVQGVLSLLKQSRGFQDAMGNPDFDIIRDSIQHFESELGQPLPELIESCGGESLLIAASVDQPTRLAAILTGRDPRRVAKLPEVALGLARKIIAGRGQAIPDPTLKSFQGQTYFQLGELYYSVSGTRWLLANHEGTLQGMLACLTTPSAVSDSEVAKRLAKSDAGRSGVQVIFDFAKLKQLPGLQPIAKWPPPDLGPIVLAAGWLDLIQRSNLGSIELDLDQERIAARVSFSATAGDFTPGTVGFFSSEPHTTAAPLLAPPHLIYSASWYRDYWKMWENRSLVPLPEQITKLEMQIASVEKGNLGYSGFDMLRLLGPHFRVVLVRPGPNPYRVEMPDRLPSIGLAIDVRDEKEFREKVLAPIQRILGIVAVTNKMVIQNSQHQNAEISAMRFTEDPAAVQNSDRVRYNFEPSYSVTRGHLLVASNSSTVRTMVDELDRLARQQSSAAAETSTSPGPTEKQILELGELSNVLTDIHSLAIRNAVLNDGLTIGEAESELSILRQIVASLGQIQVHAGFNAGGFEYRMELIPAAGDPSRLKSLGRSK